MQHSTGSSSSSRPRQRTFTSCTECRRRKQRCNQAKDRPCNNCSRRYPPVECTYESSSPPPSHDRILDFQDRTHHSSGHSHSHSHSHSHHQDQLPIGTPYSSSSINPAYTQPASHSHSHQNVSDPSSYYNSGSSYSTYANYPNTPSSYDQMTPSTSASDFVGYDDGFYSGDSSSGYGMSSAGASSGGYFTSADTQGWGATSHGGDGFVGSNAGDVFYTSYQGDVRTSRG